MTFKQIALKIIRVNAKKYMLQFCSNSFAIAVFYTYMTLLTSEKFVRVLNEHGCDDSFIYAPCIVTVVFSILFIIFSYSTFIKTRKPEFGNYLVLGMTSRNIKTLVIVESLIMSAISICIGLGTGMILSKLTSLLVKRILDISDVPIEFTLLSYEYTIGFFGAIFIIATAVSLFSIGKYEIVKLIKGTRYSDRNLLGKPWIGFIGLILTALSILYSKVYSKFFTEDQDTFPVFISIIICCIGIYIVISNTAWFSELILMPFQKKRIRGLMFVSDIRYSFGKVKNIVFVVMLLSAVTIFFCNICVYLITDCERITTGYNPYHIAYAEFPGINQLTEEKQSTILKSGKADLVEEKSISVIRNNRLFLLSQTELNTLSGSNYTVKPGNFILLTERMENDGYPHDKLNIASVLLDMKGKPNEFICQSEISKVIFNNIFGAYYIVLNDMDFESFKFTDTNNEIGQIHLFNFSDWHKTYEITEKLKNEFTTAGYTPLMFINSRLEEFNERKKSTNFQLFLFSFVGVLFFITSCLLLHFALAIDKDIEKAKFKKLYKIGITKKEAGKIISNKLLLLFILPIVLAIFITMKYCSILFNMTGVGDTIFVGTTLIGSIYLLFQIVFFIVYRRFYINSVLKL